MSSKCWEIHLRWWEKWIRWLPILSPKHVELNVLTKPFSVWSHSCHFSWSNRALKGSRLHYFSFLVPKRKITEEEFMWCQKKKNTNYIKSNVKSYAWWCKKILEWILGKDLLFNPLTPIGDKGRISPYYVYNAKQTNDENKEKY